MRIRSPAGAAAGPLEATGERENSRGGHSSLFLLCAPSKVDRILRRFQRGRKDEPKSRPAPGGALDLDLAVVELDDSVDHGQADPAPLFFGREIEVEDLLQVLRLDADAGVFHV